MKIILKIIKIALPLILCVFLGAMALIGTVIQAEDHEYIEEFKQLESSDLLNNLPNTVSEGTKIFISIYGNSAQAMESIETNQSFLYAIIILFMISLAVFVINVIKALKENKVR